MWAGRSAKRAKNAEERGERLRATPELVELFHHLARAMGPEENMRLGKRILSSSFSLRSRKPPQALRSL